MALIDSPLLTCGSSQVTRLPLMLHRVMYCLGQVTEVIAVVVHCVRYLHSTFSCGDLLPERDSLVRSDYLQINPQATTTLTLIFLTSLFGHL